MFRARAILTASVLLPIAPLAAQARRSAPTVAERPFASATELLDRRRELDLSPRQVTRLDSIERAQYAQRRAFMQQLQKQRDSVCADRRPCRLSEEERTKFREQLEKGRGNRQALWQRDSAGRVLAMSLLDSTQRGRVQGWRQGRQREAMRRGMMGRGFRDGGFGPGMGGRGMRGMGPGSMGFGPGRMGFGPGRMRERQDREFMGPRGYRGGFEGPRFRQRDFRGDDFGPGFGPRGRFMEPGDAPRMRRPMRPQLNDEPPTPRDSL